MDEKEEDWGTRVCVFCCVWPCVEAPQWLWGGGASVRLVGKGKATNQSKAKQFAQPVVIIDLLACFFDSYPWLALIFPNLRLFSFAEAGGALLRLVLRLVLILRVVLLLAACYCLCCCCSWWSSPLPKLSPCRLFYPCPLVRTHKLIPCLLLPRSTRPNLLAHISLHKPAQTIIKSILALGKVPRACAFRKYRCTTPAHSSASAQASSSSSSSPIMKSKEKCVSERPRWGVPSTARSRAVSPAAEGRGCRKASDSETGQPPPRRKRRGHVLHRLAPHAAQLEGGQIGRPAPRAQGVHKRHHHGGGVAGGEGNGELR